VKIRYQADADFNADIVAGIRRREPLIDIQSADEAGLRGVGDAQVLAYAAQEGRLLLSHDRKTMPHHFAAFIAAQPSPGLFIISQKTEVSTAIEELILIWSASEAEEWFNILVTVPF
jgi:hypothetical protein